MVFINEDSMDEVGSFRLTKKSVWTLFSTLFVITIFITVAILLFTPLKLYIPGYGNTVARDKVIRLQQSVDSLSDLMAQQQKKSASIMAILSGGDNGLRDTTMLKPGLMNDAARESILPKADDIKGKVEQDIKAEKQKSRKSR